MSCEIYVGFDEMIYSIADHGGTTGGYDGGVYIKEAEYSALLKAYAAIDPIGRKPRHSSFVGNDYCYEVLGFAEPIIRAFDSPDEAYAWGLRGKADGRLHINRLMRCNKNVRVVPFASSQS
jgi:hypothetical protein